jgi:serine/threonine-protein kinase
VGHTPFEGARHEILDKQLKAKLPLEVIKNKEYRAIIAKACEKKQELRFQTSAQMRAALEDPRTMQGGLSKQKKMMLAAAAAVLVVVLAIAGFVAKNKQDEAKEQAQKALVEKQKAQAMSVINSKLDEANHAVELGMDSESQDYEQSLITAVKAFQEAEALVKKNQQLKVKVDVATPMNKAISALQEAKTRLEGQAEGMKELGETASAESFAKRAQAVEAFLATLSSGGDKKEAEKK